MAASCCKNGEEPNGLSSSHAYTLLDVQELANKDPPIKLAKVRNPWADEKYNGPWSDGSSEWTQEAEI